MQCLLFFKLIGHLKICQSPTWLLRTISTIFNLAKCRSSNSLQQDILQCIQTILMVLTAVQMLNSMQLSKPIVTMMMAMIMTMTMVMIKVNKWMKRIWIWIIDEFLIYFFLLLCNSWYSLILIILYLDSKLLEFTCLSIHLFGFSLFKENLIFSHKVFSPVMLQNFQN